MDKRKVNLLAILHLILMGVLLALIASTPLLIREGFSVLDEELLEGIVILLLLGITLSVLTFYRREIKRREQSLAQFTRHIGTLNLQIEQIRTLYEDIQEWSAERRNLRGMVSLLADRVLGIANTAWVVLRIIDPESGRTLTECTRTKDRSDPLVPSLSNRRLLESAALDGYSVIARDYRYLRSFCVLPDGQINQSQALIIQVILDNLSLLYVGFSQVTDAKRPVRQRHTD